MLQKKHFEILYWKYHIKAIEICVLKFCDFGGPHKDQKKNFFFQNFFPHHSLAKTYLLKNFNKMFKNFFFTL